MKTAAAPMEASAEARLPAGGEASGHAPTIETAEGAGMIAGSRATKSSSAAPVEPATPGESASSTIEAAVGENPAVG